jgi:hypothetical protein
MLWGTNLLEVKPGEYSHLHLQVHEDRWRLILPAIQHWTTDDGADGCEKAIYFFNCHFKHDEHNDFVPAQLPN